MDRTPEEWAEWIAALLTPEARLGLAALDMRREDFSVKPKGGDNAQD